MKKEEILKYYKGQPLDIKGINLGKAEGVIFNHLNEHFSQTLEAELLFVKKYNELFAECKNKGISFLSAEFRKRKSEIKTYVEQKKQNGELLLTEKHKKLLEFIENLYFSSLEEEITVKQMDVENGKVIIPQDHICHQWNLSSLEQVESPLEQVEYYLKQFKSYADLGIIATEWFGILESQSEARFCVFVKGDLQKTASFEGDFSSTAILFFIDNTNPLWERLVSLDFFEYVHIKQQSPEKISSLYPKEIIELYEEILLPLSPGAEATHDYPNSQCYSWRAIPGGIPPQLINGIQIGSENKLLIQQIEKIQEMFPQAIIFDEHRTVLSQQKGKNYEDENVVK